MATVAVLVAAASLAGAAPPARGALAEGLLVEGPTRVERVERSLARIASADGRWRATVTVLAAEARATAANDDAVRPIGALGPIDGLVVTVKDNIEVTGAATSAGSASLRALGPVRSDATVVERLRGAGAIVVATTNMDTWARGVRGVSEVRGQTENPRRPGRNAGGSSAGAAASVAAAYADVAIGTDTCGSIRYPAASTGLFGLRPSQATLSRAGVVPLSPTQDTVGVIAADPALIAIVLRVMAGPDERDPAAASIRLRDPSTSGRDAEPPVAAPVRIGVVSTLGPWRRGADGSSVLDAFRRAGFELIDIGLPALPLASVIDDEAGPSRARYLSWRRAGGRVAAPGRDSPDPWLGRLEVANPSGHRARLAARAVARDRLSDLMDRLGLTAIAMPTNRADPVALGRRQPSGNCHLASTTGMPAIAVPGPLDATGVEVVGADLLGRVGDDLVLVDLATAVHRASGPSQ